MIANSLAVPCYFFAFFAQNRHEKKWSKYQFLKFELLTLRNIDKSEIFRYTEIYLIQRCDQMLARSKHHPAGI